MALARDFAGRFGTPDVEASRVSEEQPQLPLTDSEFEFFREIAKTYTGIKIADYKRNMVFRRVFKRLRALGMNHVSDYCRFLSGAGGIGELQQLINALTTNKTSFFRENHHFDHLATEALPRLQADCIARESQRLRIWSAGCSSGEEAYSIAMTMLGAIPLRADSDARILATDIDTEMVEMGRRGIYANEDTLAIPAKARVKFLEPVAGDKMRKRMTEIVRSCVDFRALNLLDPWPMKGPFDAIFCRNVVIYFDKPTQRILFDRFAEMLRDDCFLYIGHAESLYKVTQRFRTIGQNIYQKIS